MNQMGFFAGCLYRRKKCVAAVRKSVCDIRFYKLIKWLNDCIACFL